jgi:hypothetical protein
LIKKNQFACSLMQVSRDGKIPIGMFSEEENMSQTQEEMNGEEE